MSRHIKSGSGFLLCQLCICMVSFSGCRLICVLVFYFELAHRFAISKWCLGCKFGTHQCVSRSFLSLSCRLWICATILSIYAVVSMTNTSMQFCWLWIVTWCALQMKTVYVFSFLVIASYAASFQAAIWLEVAFFNFVYFAKFEFKFRSQYQQLTAKWVYLSICVILFFEWSLIFASQMKLWLALCSFIQFV